NNWNTLVNASRGTSDDDIRGCDSYLFRIVREARESTLFYSNEYRQLSWCPIYRIRNSRNDEFRPYIIIRKYRLSWWINDGIINFANYDCCKSRGFTYSA